MDHPRAVGLRRAGAKARRARRHHVRPLIPRSPTARQRTSATAAAWITGACGGRRTRWARSGRRARWARRIHGRRRPGAACARSSARRRHSGAGFAPAADARDTRSEPILIEPRACVWGCERSHLRASASAPGMFVRMVVGFLNRGASCQSSIKAKPWVAMPGSDLASWRGEEGPEVGARSPYMH